MVPVWLDTITLSPSFKGPPPALEAKLKVDPAGDGVFDLFKLRVEEDGDIEARALKLRLVDLLGKGKCTYGKQKQIIQQPEKIIIRFSIDNSIADISLYALNWPKLNFGCYLTFEIIF